MSSPMSSVISSVPFKKHPAASQLRQTQGFTLIELLVAMLVSSIAITVVALGFGKLLNADKKAAAETARRVELNRALEFMSNEIRMASNVSAASGFTTPGTGVLVLTIPTNGDAQDPSRYRAYYFDSSSNSNWGNNWLGPQAVGRATGDTTTLSGWNVLVDGISDTVRSGTLCPSGWTQTPASNPKGFYACLNGRTVQLNLIAKLPDGGEYAVQSQVTTRSAP